MPESPRSFPHRCIAVLAAIAALATSPACADEFEPVRLRIERALVDTSVPSIAVVVVREGQIVWEQGFGWADRENRTPAGEHTLYSVASVSKPITATGLMVLVERGIVDLDKPIDSYLGEAKLRARVGDAAEATVRRVANHTSGLPLHFQFFYADESYRPPTRDETIRRYANLVTAPGERYQYSNLGYGILDYVIERTSGKKYADFMREEVFLPLGLTHTSVDVGPGLESHQAIRYTPQGKRIPFYEFDHPGASAVYASAHDLARFAQFHLKEHLADQRPILRDASIDAMRASGAASPKGGYGIGWATFTNKRGYACVEHTGSMPGVSTVCRFVPAERFAVVVLSNTRGGLPYRLADMITDIVLSERKERADGASGNAGGFSSSGPFVPSAELIGTWRGKLVTHKAETPLVLKVQESGEVRVRVGRQLETLLNNPAFQDGFLRGRCTGAIDYDDDRGRPYQLHLELKLREGVLNGSATAITLPDQWGSSGVTHWAQVKREAGQK